MGIYWGRDHGSGHPVGARSLLNGSKVQEKIAGQRKHARR
jgi:hypothetical protein